MQSQIEVINDVDAKAGDYVEIDLPDSNVLGAAFKLYIIPLIVLVLTVGIAQFILKNWFVSGKAEIISAIVGFIAVVLVYIRIRLKYDNEQQKRRYMANITRIIDEFTMCDSSKKEEEA